MTGFSRRPLAVLICCMFASSQVSQAATESARLPWETEVGGFATAGAPASIFELAANDTPMKLRVERKFNVLGQNKTPLSRDVGVQAPVVLKKDDAYPLFMVADHIEGRADESSEAEGNVELRKAGSLIFADKVVYQPLEDEVDATGNVRLLQEGAEIETPHLRMKLSEQIGFADQANYRIVREVDAEVFGQQKITVKVASSNAATTGAPMMLNVPDSYGLQAGLPPRRPSEASGKAERADFEGENHYRLSNTTYSTCKPGDQDWYLKAKEIYLDYDRNVGEAKDVALWFKDVPLVYSPVGSFSLNGQRRSGILAPSLSTSTKTGVDVTVPYYWNIAPNYDATFEPRYMSKRGLQLGVEGRYLDHNYQGTTRFEYMAKDEMEDAKRYAYNIQHQQNLGHGVSAVVNWNGVSDDTYWEDLSSHLLKTSGTQLPKQVVLGYSPFSWLSTSTQFLRYQTLQPDPAYPITKPYALEPQINVVGYKANLFKTDFSLLGQYSHFTHPDKKVQGERMVFYPQWSLPIVHPAFQIVPKIGLHATKYSLTDQDAGTPSSISRTLPIFSLDSTMVFEREDRLLDFDYIQTLEPRLYYVHIPFKDQSKIPVFDSGLSDFNFAQIFSENRYSGFDRINDANQLTAAVTSRFLDAETGVERFKAMIGQRYYFKPQRVSITGETLRVDNFSHLVASVSGLVLPKTYVEAAWEYNYRESKNERLSAGMRYQPEAGKVFSAGYRYTRDPLSTTPVVDQVDIAGQWPIAPQWYAVGRYNYSIRDSQALEVIGGVEYNTGCWAARLVGQRLSAISGSPNTTLFFQLELSDFGSIGSNPLTLLRRSIPGYGKTNELPTSGSLLTQ